MSSVFKCCFWKKKDGDQNNTSSPHKEQRQSVILNTGPEVEEILNQFRRMSSRDNSMMYRRTSKELEQDPVYLRKLFGLKQNRKIRSYPTSPQKTSRDEEGYTSERQSKNPHVKNNKNPYKSNAPLVMVVDIPQKASYRPQQTNEPFPYHVPEDPVPRRSTLLYGVRFEDDPKSKENMRTCAEKPLENYARLIASNNKHNSADQDIALDGVRWITIENSDTDDKNKEKSDENAPQSEPIRKSVIRFRPHSSGSCGPLRDTVKIMNFRAEEMPPVLGKHVHKIPLKASKHSPILMTSDGRRLQAVHEDKLRRSSIESEIETRQIRYSSAGSVKLAGSVDHRKSIVCRESKNERRKSYFRDNVVQEEVQNFPFDRETKPVIYAVPVVPVDPLIKFREGTVCAKPRRQSVRRSLELKQSTTPTLQTQVAYQHSPRAHVRSIRKKHSRVYTDYKDEDFTSSEENIDVYRKKSKQGVKRKPYYQHTIYAAHTPKITLPYHSTTGKRSSFKKTGNHGESSREYFSNKDLGGSTYQTQDTNVKMVSSAIQSDIDDETDLICYPSETFFRNTPMATESGSKLKWRIIIKRGEESKAVK